MTRKRIMRQRRFMMTAVLVLGLSGCGGDGLRRVPIQGRITANGQPLDNAIIQFIPMGVTQGEGGIGRSDRDGNFTLTGSRQGAQGVVPGEYRVRVSRIIARDGTVLGPDAKQADNPGCRESVPAGYTSLEGTILKATVPEAGGSIQLDIHANIARSN